MKRALRRSVATALTGVLLLAFSISSVDAATKLRVAHLSPDAPNVDVRVNGEIVLTDVPFQAVSDYLDVVPGEYNVQVTPAGADDPVVIDATVTLAENTAYTVAATGLLASEDLQPVVLVDDVTGQPNQATIRVIHTSPDAPAVDVALAGGDVLFPNIAFRESSEYLTVPADSYDLEVRVQGTDTVALPLPGVTLEAGTVYNVFAVGLLADETLGALISLSAAAEPAEVRVAHLSPDAPNVDVRVDGSVALNDVPFGAVSQYLELDPGSYNVQVTPAGAAEPVVIDANVAVAAGVSYTIAATGLLGEGDLSPLVVVDDRSVEAEQARVSFVHASPDAPAVDVALKDGAVLFGDVSFRESAAPILVDAGSYDLEVRVAGTDTVALDLPGVQLRGGTSVTVYAIGLLADESLTALPVLTADELFVRGDANQDGEIDISDPISILRDQFLGFSGTFCDDAADVDDDGHILLNDPILLLDYIFLGGAAPAEPFPSPGLDLTEDGLSCGEF